MNISIAQACRLWDELRDAMDGKASHGHEAEIYAYTIMPSIPSISDGEIKQHHITAYIRAIGSLVNIIEMFTEIHENIDVFIDGEHYYSWAKKAHLNYTHFNHRVKVEIRINQSPDI